MHTPNTPEQEWTREAGEIEIRLLNAIEGDLKDVGEFLFRRMNARDFVTEEARGRYEALLAKRSERELANLYLNGKTRLCAAFAKDAARLCLLASALRTRSVLAKTLVALDAEASDLPKTLNAVQAAMSLESAAAARRMPPPSIDVNPRDSVMGVIEDIEHAVAHRGEKQPVREVCWGELRTLSIMTRGIPRGSLSLVFAQPGAGKSAFLLTAMQGAMKHDDYVALISVRDSERTIIERLLLGGAKVHPLSARTGYLLLEEYPKLTTAAAKINKRCVAAAMIDRAPLHALIPTVEAILANHQPRILCIDDIDACLPEGGGSHTREELVTTMQHLRRIARSTLVPIVVSAHFADDWIDSLDDTHADIAFKIQPPPRGQSRDVPFVFKLLVYRNAYGPRSLLDMVYHPEAQQFFEAAEDEH